MTDKTILALITKMIMKPQKNETLSEWRTGWNCALANLKLKIEVEKMDKVTELLARLDIKPPQCGFSIGDGWFPIVEVALEKMVAAGWDHDLQQVKQKFCGLRIYIGDTNQRIDEIISWAEALCWRACEHCGKPHGIDFRGFGGWGEALCEECRK